MQLIAVVLMKLLLNTNMQPMMLATRVDAPVRSAITVSVRDTAMPDTYYSRSTGITPSYPAPLIFTRLPLSPMQAEFEVTGGRVLEVKHYPLYTNAAVYNRNGTLKSFLEFIQFFARRKNILAAGRHTNEDAGSYYSSDDGKFRIQYVDEIYDWCKYIRNPKTGKAMPNPNYGQPMTSSMQINSESRLMRIAKRYAYDYTIPEFMAIALHEFSHGYVNQNPADEKEADRNALHIYSGLGFPRHEGANAFLKVFQRSHNARPGTPQDNMNVERIYAIINELNKMDKKTFKIIGDGQEI